jgi:hypothetical protein
MSAMGAAKRAGRPSTVKNDKSSKTDKAVLLPEPDRPVMMTAAGLVVEFDVGGMDIESDVMDGVYVVSGGQMGAGGAAPLPRAAARC